MALFSEHPVRHVLKAILALAAVHVIMKFMPQSIQILHLTQTSVTIIAIAALVFLVVLHHRSESGRVLSQTQEEMIIIAAFGAFWFAFLIAMRTFNQSSVDVNLAHPRNMFSPGARESAAAASGVQANAGGYRGAHDGRYGQPQAGFRNSHPCNPNDAYCVVEEWTFY